MREVHVRRHAPKHAKGGLTEEGKKTAQELREKIGRFDLVISSDKPRAQETAVLLTGKEPIIDMRAGTPAFTPEQEEQLHLLGEHHPFGIAGVILDTPEYREMIKEKGESLAGLVRETLTRLPEKGRALIISHDGVMVASERILTKQTLTRAVKTYKPLQGYKLNEMMEIEDLQ